MVVEYDMIQDGHRGMPIEASASAFGQAEVDLERNRTYEENRRDIEVVDRFGIEAVVSNVGGSPTSLSIYLSDRADLTDPAREATLLVRDLAVPAGGAVISYRDTESRFENAERFRSAVRDGSFTLYYVSEAANPVSIAEMNLIVTVTVGY
jgi:hypothetical protein